ncbi:MAG: hypothetical protein ACKOEW_06880 [Methylocystis sp.]
MFIKYHDLETYYLQRRLDLLQILDQFAHEAFNEEDVTMDDDHWKMQMLKREYADVIDPENLCQTLKRIYPDHLFGIESKRSKSK